MVAMRAPIIMGQISRRRENRMKIMQVAFFSVLLATAGISRAELAQSPVQAAQPAQPTQTATRQSQTPANADKFTVEYMRQNDIYQSKGGSVPEGYVINRA